MRELKILHLVDSLDPAHGGPPVAVLSLAAAQSSIANVVTVACRRRSAAVSELVDSFYDLPGIDTVHLIDYEYGLPSSLVKFGGLDELPVDMSGDSILHVHGLWRPEFTKMIRQAYAKHIPVVIAPLGMLAPWSLKQKAFKKAFAWRISWQQLLQQASCIHALNVSEQEQVRELGIDTPSRIIPNGVFQHADDSSIAWPDVLPATVRRYVLFLGRLHPVKGLDILASAFAQVADRVEDVDLVLAGPDDGDAENFIRRIESLGIRHRVHLLGPVYDVGKEALLAHASCLCQPSRQEGFSMSIVEALGFGTPVVISEFCHMPEVAETGAGRVVPLDPGRVATALLELLQDPGGAREAGLAASRLVAAEYRWPMIARQTVELYVQLLNEKHSAAGL